MHGTSCSEPKMPALGKKKNPKMPAKVHISSARRFLALLLQAERPAGKCQDLGHPCMQSKAFKMFRRRYFRVPVSRMIVRGVDLLQHWNLWMMYPFNFVGAKRTNPE